MALSVGSTRVLLPVLRNGISCGETKPPGTGRNRSGVSVWACATPCSNAISARHAKAARKIVARLRRPLAGPVITIKILQQIHTLADRVPFVSEPAAENVVNGVKTIMVNDPLRTPA